jgi:UDP-N-acetylmuramate dehydrogenase
MNIDDIEKNSNKFTGKIYFDYDISKLNWFNIGGKAAIYFKPETLKDLTSFLSIYKQRGKIFLVGAGSNVLFKDEKYEGAIVKLSKNFSNISLLKDNIIVAGSAVLDKNISEYAMQNSIGGFEFLSCIPGTVGGGIRMNSGCFDKEFKDILISVQAMEKSGKVIAIPANDIIFSYRSCNLSKDIIFLSASFKGKKKDKKKIEEEIKFLKNKKEISQPTRVKTGGSTFKNPKDQTNKKVWELIQQSVPLNYNVGNAAISEKHCNFLINKGNASYKDMKNLIDYIKKCVCSKTGIKLDLEIVLVE